MATRAQRNIASQHKAIIKAVHAERNMAPPAPVELTALAIHNAEQLENIKRRTEAVLAAMQDIEEVRKRGYSLTKYNNHEQRTKT